MSAPALAMTSPSASPPSRHFPAKAPKPLSTSTPTSAKTRSHSSASLETQEKRLFEKLLTISGIGPKLAITVLSGIDASRLVTAIRSGDHATLTRIPGIGKKTAERVVLELKDKLDDLAVAIPTTAGGPHHGPAGDDALSALVNLGYARPIAQKAIETAITKDPAAAHDFETLFRAAMAAIR